MQTMEQMRLMSANDLAMFGMQDIAYVKPVVVEGNSGFAIHAADGTQMAGIGDRDIAFAVVRQNELEPVSVHCPVSVPGARRECARNDATLPFSPAGQKRIERVRTVCAAQFLAHR